MKGETETTIVPAQTILRIKFLKKKWRLNAGYVSNMKKLLTI